MIDAAGAYERDLSDGLRDYERDILARWDSGRASIADIAAATGRSRRTVENVISLYDVCEPAHDRAALAAANAAYCARVAAVMARAHIAIEVREIVDLLTDRIESLVHELLPNARRVGNEMVCGGLAGEPGRRLSIHVGSGMKRGWWVNFANEQERGDALKLIAAVHFGGDQKRAIAWAKSWLGIDDGDPARIERHRIEARANADKRAAEAEAERRQAIERARRRWLGAREISAGDPVTRYLAGRAIDLARLPRLPGALRYHPKLAYGWQGPEVPAMVAPIVALSGDIIGLHRTWLDVAKGGKAGPELIGYQENGTPNDPKKVMGRWQGGHIPLWKGASDATLRDVPPGTDIYVSEGIEDGLTVACADPRLRVIAMISVGNFAQLELPPQMGRLVLVKQNDPPGSPADLAIKRGIAAHRAAGRRVFLVNAPAGVKDVNDVARGVM